MVYELDSIETDMHTIKNYYSNYVIHLYYANAFENFILGHSHA